MTVHEAFFMVSVQTVFVPASVKRPTYHLVLRKPPCSSEKLFRGASCIISRVINFAEKTVAEDVSC